MRYRLHHIHDCCQVPINKIQSSLNILYMANAGFAFWTVNCLLRLIDEFNLEPQKKNLMYYSYLSANTLFDV
jgi:hypothetical protein